MGVEGKKKGGREREKRGEEGVGGRQDKGNRRKERERQDHRWG